jgi:hypothetical protein
MRASPPFGSLGPFVWVGSFEALALFASTLATACGSLNPGVEDPVHQGEVDALGAESSSIPTGPYHRAGQPCTVCHGNEGPAHTPFAVAGTVFAAAGQTVGVDGAELLMVDSLGSSPPPGSVLTNCVGNFFVPFGTWNPAFPIRVAVASGQSVQQMIGHSGRQGSCAFCHKDPVALDSPGHVYVGVTPKPNNPSCPVSPVLGGDH